MNKNAGKYLAAVIAMLMIVCAVAVVAMPAEAADSEAPAAEFGEAVAKPIASADDIYKLSEDDATYDSINKVLTINQPTILSINKDVTIPDLRIVLNDDLKITGEGKLDITATSKGTAYGAYTVSFNADDAVLVIDGADVTLDVDETKGSVFNNMYTYDSTQDKWAAPGHDGAVQVVKKAVLTVNHTNGGSTWLGAPASSDMAAWLIVNDATVNFDGTKSIQEIVVDADSADINFTDVLIGPSILAGSDFNASSLSVSGADLNGIYVKGDITLKNGSSFEVTNASGTNADRPGLMISNVEETTITMDETSSIAADTIGLTDKADGYSSTQNGVKIVGGAVSGTFTPVKTAADTPAKTQPAYALDGTKVTGNSIIDTGSVVAPADETGFIVDGNLRNKGTIDTTNGPVDVTGKLTNTATGVISGEKEITGTGSVINDGAIEVPVDNEDYTNNNMEEVFVYGNSQKSFWYPADQMVTVPAGQTWTIVAGGLIVVPGVLNVEGSLVLEEGATLVVGAVEDSPMNDNGTGTANIADTLTIEENAKLIISRGTSVSSAACGETEESSSRSMRRRSVSNDSREASSFLLFADGEASEHVW